ncbi:MAG: MarR family winged helix-turn-helix transcriptional regulator [Candidatus Acidiferrales bacterium]
MAGYTPYEKTQRALEAYRVLAQATESADALVRHQTEFFGVSLSQFRVLEVLLRLGPTTQATICEELRASHATVSATTATLVARGLVTQRKDKKDRRKKMVRLTPQGQELIKRLFPLCAKMIRAQMSALTTHEQQTLQRLCEKLREGDLRSFAAAIAMID